jgi:quercetin dioxygenase-like cupin family protein
VSSMGCASWRQRTVPSTPAPARAVGRSSQLLRPGGRWALGEVIAEPDEGVATHLHPGEPEAIVILEGGVELHGREGVIRIGAGDVVFIPPDTEHGLRTPDGGRWLAIWPAGAHDRVPGRRYGTRP